MIHVVDIGSLRLPDGDRPYQPLLDRRLGCLTSFDPQEYTAAIGDGKAATLYVCKYPGWTSLLRPSQGFLAAFPWFKENAEVIREEAIVTQRLDDLDIAPIDLLKMDVQGSELMILENGRKKLRECSVIQLEVPFLELYDGQPQLWQLDKELRQQGFVLAGFQRIKQLVDADAVYVRYGSAHMEAIFENCYAGRKRKVA